MVQVILRPTFGEFQSPAGARAATRFPARCLRCSGVSIPRRVASCDSPHQADAIRRCLSFQSPAGARVATDERFRKQSDVPGVSIPRRVASCDEAAPVWIPLGTVSIPRRVASCDSSPHSSASCSSGFQSPAGARAATKSSVSVIPLARCFNPPQGRELRPIRKASLGLMATFQSPAGARAATDLVSDLVARIGVSIPRKVASCDQ